MSKLLKAFLIITLPISFPFAIVFFGGCRIANYLNGKEPGPFLMAVLFILGWLAVAFWISFLFSLF